MVDPKLHSPVRDNGTWPYENDLGDTLPDIYGEMTKTVPPDPLKFVSGSDAYVRKGGRRGKQS